MLSLEVNGAALDLPKEFSLTLNLKSPMFNDIGDYSFPFKIPSTDRNKSILGWKHRIESARDQYEFYDGSLLFNTSVIFSGQVRIKEAIGNLMKEMLADSKELRVKNPWAFWIGAPLTTFLFFGPILFGQPIVIIAYFAAKPAAAKKFLATARGKKKKTHKEA